VNWDSAKDNFAYTYTPTGQLRPWSVNRTEQETRYNHRNKIIHIHSKLECVAYTYTLKIGELGLNKIILHIHIHQLDSSDHGH